MKTQGNRNTEHADPHEQYNPVPRVMLGLVIALVGWAASYIFIQGADGVPSLGDRRQVAALAEGSASKQGALNGTISGAQIYAANCQACHQVSGQGLPGVFPPLAGSPWVKGDPSVLSQILLHGLTGPVEVLGATYNGAMPTFAKQLSDAEIAAVTTYIRSQWGNNAPAIDAAAVASARAASAGREEPWHGTDELMKQAAGGQKP
jgi:mono/diheme cytochrome c family protein